jgi:amino acid permease
MAGIPALGSIFNVVITISVISVANSATYASTRTLQALAMQGMAPKLLAYVDKAGRPVPTIILQLLFGLLAFINVRYHCLESLPTIAFTPRRFPLPTSSVNNSIAWTNLMTLDHRKQVQVVPFSAGYWHCPDLRYVFD